MAITIITASRSMQKVVEMADRIAAAPSATTVLITGETGTGKDLLAAYIHDRSQAAGPFVTIDCAALPEALIESELFGHERGAFTGAVTARAGRLEAARGGTLVLDEIAALPHDAQAKLLRLLDERSFTRLGGTRPVALEARVIALTNIDLARAIAAGMFREDLYYRLNVVSLALPPLREQREAIAPLAEFFAERFTRRTSGPSGPLVSQRATALLERCSFPGNARELRNAIEFAVVHGGAGQVEPEALPASLRAGARSGDRATLAEVESAYILKVLEDVGGNKSEAARILGISRKSLYERLEKMDGRAR